MPFKSSFSITLFKFRQCSVRNSPVLFLAIVLVILFLAIVLVIPFLAIVLVIIFLAIVLVILDVDPRRDDDASPMSTYRCML